MDHARPFLADLPAMRAKVCHEAYSALHLVYQLCYAMAGSHVRVCMLRRDNPDSCLVLNGNHKTYAMRGRLQLLRIAVLWCDILAIQQTQVLSDAVPLGSELEIHMAQQSLSWKNASQSQWTLRSNCLLLTSWQCFSSCTKQQKPVSMSYGLKMIHTLAPGTQSLYVW